MASPIRPDPLIRALGDLDANASGEDKLRQTLRDSGALAEAMRSRGQLGHGKYEIRISGHYDHYRGRDIATSIRVMVFVIPQDVALKVSRQRDEPRKEA